jgi:DNA-binding transcriptional regulator LsrR (DeoR family)
VVQPPKAVWGKTRESGAVCDSLGKLFDIDGREINHPLGHRTVGIETNKE